jgi:hypothetical protein
MGVPVPSITIFVRGDCAPSSIGASRIRARHFIVLDAEYGME